MRDYLTQCLLSLYGLGRERRIGGSARGEARRVGRSDASGDRRRVGAVRSGAGRAPPDPRDRIEPVGAPPRRARVGRHDPACPSRAAMAVDAMSIWFASRSTSSRPADGCRPERALFVCTHNSARSQLAAAMWRVVHRRSGRVGGYTSVRHRDTPVRSPPASGPGLDDAVRAASGADVESAASDLVITVCDEAHEETQRLARTGCTGRSPTPSRRHAALRSTGGELSSVTGSWPDRDESMTV